MTRADRLLLGLAVALVTAGPAGAHAVGVPGATATTTPASAVAVSPSSTLGGAAAPNLEVPDAPVDASLDINDAASTRTVNLIVAALVALGVGVLGLAGWYWVTTRPVAPALLGLEVVGSRRFRRADPDSRRALLTTPRSFDDRVVWADAVDDAGPTEPPDAEHADGAAPPEEPVGPAAPALDEAEPPVADEPEPPVDDVARTTPPAGVAPAAGHPRALAPPLPPPMPAAPAEPV